MSPPRVLIVDDDPALLRALPEALRLRLEAVTVETCDSAAEALERVAATDYDAIISDIKMPGMDGLALLAKIRAARPDTPTLLITGHGEHDLAVQALRGGAYDFIQKPIEREYFVASLSRAIHLRHLRRRVTELDQLKTQFFANVSHELRTPLALVLGPTQKLLAAEGLTGEQRQDLEVIDRNARTLLKHVTDLLDIAKLDAGQMHLNYAEVELGRLLRLTGSHFDAFAHDRRVAFTLKAPEHVTLQGDAEKLQRVFLNLLSNAFKFVPDGGSVHCELWVEGNRAVVAVQDNGPGVKPELRELIFERFRQGDDHSSRRFGGTGLGLAIAKDFVALHGGTITVDDAPGGGALFSVRLPLTAPAAVAGVPPAARESADREDVARQTLDELRRHRIAADAGRAPAHGPGDPAVATEERPLVLVVEDNHEMNRFIAEAFAGRYRVACAFDGQEGLEKALALRPDLILSDVIMPRVSGDALVREVRTHAELATVPIVLLTAKVDDELRLKLLRTGAQDYLTKPFSAEELRTRVSNLIAMKQARETLQHDLASRTSDLSALAREVAARRRELHAALGALQESEERSRLLVECVRDYAIFMLDLDGRVGSWNAGAERIMGYSADEIAGQHFSRFYPAAEIRNGAPEHDLNRTTADGRVETDGQRVRKDGVSFWANTILTALRNVDGRLRGFSVVTRDITERRCAEEQIAASLREKEILLKELHHRVKNNLQVISSLLSLQSRTIEDGPTRELFDASRGRVKSMALIHEQLYRSHDLATVDFGEYVRSLAGNLFRSYAGSPDAVALTLDVEDVSLTVDTALPCGLIINELITNSLKHAFPRGRKGEIRVGLRAEADQTYELSISDDGIGLPADSDAAGAPSSGLQLVATLAEQVGANVEVQRDGGTRFRIRFPRRDKGGGP
jgi:PAS domain S-box-containing protein